MEKRECVSCGAPIEVGATRCSYCGMTYEPKYWDGLIRYIPYHANMRRIETRTIVPDEYLIYGDAEALSNMAKRDIVQKLAEVLSEIATYRISKDPVICSTIINASVLTAQDRR